MTRPTGIYGTICHSHFTDAWGFPISRPENAVKLSTLGEPNMKPLCIYHGNCADGFAAAWVVRKYFQQRKIDDTTDSVEMPEFYAGVYQKDPPDCTGRDVIIVDFSYKRPVMEKILAECKSLTWIDHHKSAIADMDGFPENEKFMKFLAYDNEHSGAMLTWLYYFPDVEEPQLLKHIEDRDLWLFKLPRTREIQANIFSHPYDFELWDGLMAMRGQVISMFAMAGEAIERKHFKDIHELLNIYTRWMIIGGVEMPVANLPYTMSSDAGHILAENAVNGCAACYSDGPGGRLFSLRSNGKPDSADVSKIAMLYGGGGHRNAAGFAVAPSIAASFEILKTPWRP